MATWTAAIHGTLTGTREEREAEWGKIIGIVRADLPASTVAAVASAQRKSIDLRLLDDGLDSDETFSIALQGSLPEPDDEAVMDALRLAHAQADKDALREEKLVLRDKILIEQMRQTLLVVKDQVAAMCSKFDHDYSVGSFGEMFDPLVS